MKLFHSHLRVAMTPALHLMMKLIKTHLMIVSIYPAYMVGARSHVGAMHLAYCVI